MRTLTLIEHLQLIDVHYAYFIWRNSLLIPKLFFTFRTAPIYISSELPLFDRLVKDFCENLQHTNLSGKSWLQATLPIKLGGIGLRSLESIASSAYDIIERALVYSENSETKEPRGISRLGGKRPNGQTIYLWKRKDPNQGLLLQTIGILS